MKEVIDSFGWNSAQAQGLQRAVTDYNRMKTSEHMLILICKPHWVRGTRVIGGIKCGMKHLFFKKETDFVEVEPMCVLDFYVHEKYQRKGFGHKLFHRFLKVTNEDPSTIAYDRPSSKLLAFLMKYYGCPELVYSQLAQSCSSLQCSTGMTRSIQHNNNFAVFESFLENAKLRKVRIPGKKNGRNSRSGSMLHGNQSAIRQDSLHSSSSIKESRTGTASASSSLVSNYSSLNSDRSRKTTSPGARQKTPYMVDSDRNVLKRLPGRLIDLPTKDPLISSNLDKTPLGPYPGFELRNFDNDEETSSSRYDNNQMKNEPKALTRLALVESPFLKNNGRQTPPCIPPWATNLPVDKKGLPSRKLNTALVEPDARQSAAYQSYRRRSVSATGVKNCLQWNGSKVNFS
eukprot:g8328.t1